MRRGVYRYDYASNSPLGVVDPSGLQEIDPACKSPEFVGGMTCWWSYSNCRIGSQSYEYIGTFPSSDLGLAGCGDLDCYGNRKTCGGPFERTGGRFNAFSSLYGCYCGGGNTAQEPSGSWSITGPLPWDDLDQCCATHDDSVEGDGANVRPRADSPANRAFCACLRGVTCNKGNNQERQCCTNYLGLAWTLYCTPLGLER